MLVVSSSRAMALPARRSLLALLAGSSFVLIALYLIFIGLTGLFPNLFTTPVTP